MIGDLIRWLSVFIQVVMVLLNSKLKKEIANMYITSQSVIDFITASLIILQTVFQDNGEILSGAIYSCSIINSM